MKYKLIITKSINIECKDTFYITTSAHETIRKGKKNVVIPDIIVSVTELYLINEILGDFKIPHIPNYKAMHNYSEVLQFAKDIKLFSNDDLYVMITSLENEIAIKSLIYSEIFINKIKNIIALIKLARSIIAKPIIIFVSVDKDNSTDTIITRDDEKKRIVENFIIFASDPVETIQHVSGQLQEVFQQLLDEINSDETKKTMFTHTMGYMSEIAELYYDIY